LHVHPVCVALLALGLASWATAGEPPSGDAAASLCRGRAGCAIVRHRPVPKSPKHLEIIDVRIAHRPDAAADEDRCDRREYWLLRPEGPALLATDCEEQWGADNPGPAVIQVSAREARFKYVEFQSSDGCETVDATVQLDPLVIKRQLRRQGTTRGNACVPKGRASPVAQGDGSPDHPVLVLHR
jgi:hypothetical protein